MPSRSGRLLVLAVLTATACSDVGATAVRVAVVGAAALGVDALEVTAGDRSASTPLVTTLQVLVPDEWAGTPLTIGVVGLKAGQRRGSGETSVTPVRGREVAATVTLLPIACGAWCTAGATDCVGDAVVTCEAHEGDPCLAWSAPTACAAPTPFCSHGRCDASCTPECAAGETRCDGPEGLRTCGQPSPDHCLVWLPAVACPAGQTCSAGRCGTACADECTAGAAQCAGTGTSTCGDLDQDGCTEWGPVTPCAAGTSCSLGVCTTDCTDECDASRCDGLVWRECGQFDLDPCRDLSPGGACATGDVCQTGQCTPAGCTRSPTTCDAPPAAACVDGSTLRVYDAAGTCAAPAGCTYPAREVSCPSCPSCDPCASVVCPAPPSVCYAGPGTCSAGACRYNHADGVACDDGDACTTNDRCASGACAGTAVTCTTPPAPTCVSATTLRTFASPGTCAAGACAYPSVDQTCAAGCGGGACLCSYGAWVIEDVDDTLSGGPPSIAVSPAGDVRILHGQGNASSISVRVVWPTGTGTWGGAEITSVNDLSVNRQLELAFGGDGAFHAAVLVGDDDALLDWCGFTDLPLAGPPVVHVGAVDVDQAEDGSLSWCGGYTMTAAGRRHALWSIGPEYGYAELAYEAWTGTYVQGTPARTITEAAGRLAVDASGGVHLLYVDTALRYAYRPAGATTWQEAVVDSAGAAGLALSVDAAGTAHAAWLTGTTIMYARRPAGGPWAPVTAAVATATATWLSLGIDPHGRVHLAYSDDTAAPGPVPYLYSVDGVTFTKTTVGAAGAETPSLAIDAAGTMHLTLPYRSLSLLRYAHRSCN
jgi:hypothetical protein